MRQTKHRRRTIFGEFPVEATALLAKSAERVRNKIAEGGFKGFTEEPWLLESIKDGLTIPLNHDCSILDFTSEDFECSPDYA